jgi:hypothetical protein
LELAIPVQPHALDNGLQRHVVLKTVELDASINRAPRLLDLILLSGRRSLRQSRGLRLSGGQEDPILTSPLWRPSPRVEILACTFQDQRQPFRGDEWENPMRPQTRPFVVEIKSSRRSRSGQNDPWLTRPQRPIAAADVRATADAIFKPTLRSCPNPVGS